MSKRLTDDEINDLARKVLAAATDFDGDINRIDMAAYAVRGGWGGPPPLDFDDVVRLRDVLRDATVIVELGVVE